MYASASLLKRYFSEVGLFVGRLVHRKFVQTAREQLTIYGVVVIKNVLLLALCNSCKWENLKHGTAN